MRSIDLGSGRLEGEADDVVCAPRAYVECSDSTNYAPPANAKCMRNKPRARMPPNGRNCISPPLPPSISRRTRASHRCLMHVCSGYSKILGARIQSTRCRIDGKRVRVNVPRGSLVSFSIPHCTPCTVGLPLTQTSSSFLALSSSLIPPVRDFFLPSLSPCIIPVTRRGGILHA